MKILNLSDLHRQENKRIPIVQQQAWIDQMLKRFNPDLILITGDIFESNNYYHDIKTGGSRFNPYEILSQVFDGRPVICTLGNHEFFNLSVKEVMDYYTRMYNPDAFDVHYLDVVNFIDAEKYTFLGNVLWYDGSMATVPNQDIWDFAGDSWQDKTIVKFNWKKENKKCVKKIMDVQTDKKKILCTHCVPHWRLNGHIRGDDLFDKKAPYNAFSGMNNLLKLVKPYYAFSGHTHLRRNLELDGCNCVNCGNDYHPPFQYFQTEI